MNPYSVLGLSPDASIEEIRDAYSKLSFEWNPVLFYGADSQTIERVCRKYQDIKEAYSTLKDPPAQQEDCKQQNENDSALKEQKVKRVRYSAAFSKYYLNDGAKSKPKPLPYDLLSLKNKYFEDLLLLKYKNSDKLGDRLKYRIETLQIWFENREKMDVPSGVSAILHILFTALSFII